jgi:hypothetical protein
MLETSPLPNRREGGGIVFPVAQGRLQSRGFLFFLRKNFLKGGGVCFFLRERLSQGSFDPEILRHRFALVAVKLHEAAGNFSGARRIVGSESQTV